MTEATEKPWWMLNHQIPPRPNYFRVKVGRRLRRLGAVAVKNSVYVLLTAEGTVEDLQWVLQQSVKGGGDASLCEANFVDGLSDEQIEALFHSARKADFDKSATEARRLEEALPKRDQEIDEAARAQIETDRARMSRRLGEVSAIDFFGTTEREVVVGLIAGIAMAHKDDEVRLSRACAVLDDLYEYSKRKASQREKER